MDFVNRSFDQIKDVFNSMTPGARITAALLLVVIVVAVAFLFQSPLASSDNYLLAGRAFSVPELEAIEGAFAKAGLSNYETEGSRVRIPSANKHEYIAALADNNALPANFGDDFKSAGKASNPFETKNQAQQRWRTAKQQELALTISHMQGISLAQVIYDEVEKPGFPRKVEKTATVAVKGVGTNELEQHQIQAVSRLVSAAFAGLSHNNVTVTDLNTGRSHGGGGGEFAGISEDPYYERKRYYEDLWREKIKKTVSFVPGVEVTVDVSLNKDTLLREDTVSIDPKPVTVESNTFEKSATNSRSNPRGRPGAAAQQNGLANQGSSIGAGGLDESNTEEASENIRKLAAHTRTVRDTAALVPQKVTAVVGIPSSYYAKVWRERNPPVDGEEPATPDATQLTAIENEVIKKVEDMVVSLIPVVDVTEDRFPMVKVKTVDHLASDPIEPPGLTQNAAAWFASNWSTLGMLLVGAFGLMMFRSMIKQRPEPKTNAAADDGLPPNLSIVGGEEGDDEDDQEQPKRSFQSSGTNIKEELAAMVRENPDAAANILRSWIGEAS